MFVKPKAGVRVRDPKTGMHIPESGVEVPENVYWTRKVIDGDVERVTQLPTSTPSQPETKAK